MREILFRGKRIDNGEWVESNGISQPFDGVVRLNTIVGYVDVYPETVGQYTGLTDKNSRKIFEGDLLRGRSGRVFSVAYNPDIAGFVTRPTDGDEHSRPCMNYGTTEHYAVIGTVYDANEGLFDGLWDTSWEKDLKGACAR